MSFFYEVQRASQSAYRALGHMNSFNWNEDPRSSFNTTVLNSAHSEIVNGALPAAKQAQWTARYEPVVRQKVDQVNMAVQHLTDATWELTSYSKYGGQDMPNPQGARWQIEQGLNLLRQAEARWTNGRPGPDYPYPNPYPRPRRPYPGPVYPNPYPGPVYPNPYPRPGYRVRVGTPPPNTGGSGWHPGSGRPVPPKW